MSNVYGIPVIKYDVASKIQNVLARELENFSQTTHRCNRANNSVTFTMRDLLYQTEEKLHILEKMMLLRPRHNFNQMKSENGILV